jgi:nucleoside-diphosphate-sugar epimerase
MKKNILITGGTGFIGSNITNFLLKQGYKVTVFDNNLRGNLKRIKKNKNFRFIKGDIRNYNDLNKSFKNINSIIHLAYINGTKYFYEKPELVLDVAVKGLVNIFDIAIKNNVKEMFLASSSEVYQTPNKVPTDEMEILKIPNIFNPRYSYGGGKILSELYGINFGRKYFKKLIIFRPHNVYGKNMGNEHVIPELIKKFKKNSKTIKIQGSGNEKRSFIHVDDFCDAFYKIFTKGKHLNIYNIGTTEMVSIKKLVKIISTINLKKVKILKNKLKIGGTKIRCPNINKIKKLGFKPKISLKSGISKIF